MKLCGIIAEFNPLTNGHDYIIKKVKQTYKCDVAVIMSGNFSQRGEITILDKYTRTKNAIQAGADIVIELPTCFTLSSAPYFAYGGVKILADIGITHLAFGVKIDNPEKLITVAKLKCSETKEMSKQISAFMKLGQNYNTALIQTYKQTYPELKLDLEQIFTEPNNILAVEYLSAIYANSLDITPIFINREDRGYNSTKINSSVLFGKKKKLANATYIRNLIKRNKRCKIKPLVPSFTFESIKSNASSPLSETRLDAVLLSVLRALDYKDYETFADYNIGLAHLVKDNSLLFSSKTEIVNALESKCYRKSRINKLLLIAYFKIKKDFLNSLKKPYAINVLGVSVSKRKLLSNLIKTSKAKLIVSLTDLKNLEPELSTFIIQNQANSNLYNICNQKPQTTDKAIFV